MFARAGLREGPFREQMIAMLPKVVSMLNWVIDRP